MGKFSEIVSKIEDSIHIKDYYGLKNYFYDLGECINDSSLTFEQIYTIIELLYDSSKKLVKEHNTVFYDVQDLLEVSLFTKLSLISEDSLDKIVSIVYEKFSNTGLNTLMSVNFDTIRSFKLFILIYIRVENVAYKKLWVSQLHKNNDGLTIIEREKLLHLFDWIKKYENI